MNRHAVFPTTLLIDLPNWVGDTMMALSAVTTLAASNRTGTTMLNARPSMARFLEAVFPGSQVVATPAKASPAASARILCRRLAGRPHLRSADDRPGFRRFDVGITFRNAYRAKILLRLASQRSFGSAGQGATLLLSHRFHPNRERHQAFDADPILKQLALEGVSLPYEPVPPEDLVTTGFEILRDAGLGSKPMIGLAPSTASDEAKRWPAAKFAALATSLEEQGFDPVILIGPGEEGIGRSISERAGRPYAILGCDQDVAGLAGLAAQMAVVVGVDSGPLHVASVMGTPVVALFGPTVPTRTAPSGRHNEILFLGLECTPCHHSRCPHEHHACMQGHEIESVVAAILRLDQRLTPQRRSGAGA